jgi:TPR repeat protein
MKADTVFDKEAASRHRRYMYCMPKKGQNTGDADEVPFDLYGDLEDAYDGAERNGDVEIVKTLDTFGLWDEKPRCNRSWMYTMWRALKGDVEAQADVGNAFYWNDYDQDDVREKYKWLDKPLLAIYWYNLAAEKDYAPAQSDLACLYCPNLLPHSKLKIGRFARHWWEEAATHKHSEGLRGLAHCLRCAQCGKECYCEQDFPRADALEAEADEIERRNREQGE